ncbi:bactofilin family protein [Lunatibacter salilacus]|uniref:bactofilin family protein n=1 Tax=Lunatibacter salilacus TaxID=2483804 RepID=UPI00131CFC88|nr:polymer-forming cytoskeletal protein [Lunatibacter salilacus]
MKFGSNKQQDDGGNVSKVTVLSLGFELTGDIISKSDIRADGILVGSIRTDKKVVVGEKASITGDIIAAEISISGEVVGDLFIGGETTIYASAKVSGNITTQQIFIHKGAELNSLIRTVDGDAVKSAAKSSKLNTVSREELYSIMDEKKSKITKEVEKPVQTKRVESNFYTEDSNSKEEFKPNFPRTW